MDFIAAWNFIAGNFSGALLPLFAAGGGGAAIAFAIFKIFGEKWLSSRFDKQLAELRHTQQKELERLKFDLTASVDRQTKIYQREFDVIPEAWAQLTELYQYARSAIIRFHQHADLNQMNRDKLIQYLNDNNFDEREKEFIISSKAEERNSKFSKVISLRTINETRNKFNDHLMYISKFSIFIPYDMIIKFNNICNIINEALVDVEFEVQGMSGADLNQKLNFWKKEISS